MRAGLLLTRALTFRSQVCAHASIQPHAHLNTHPRTRLQRVLLGAVQSFSAGGPGKGMYSRLYREVLNRHAGVEAAAQVGGKATVAADLDAGSAAFQRLWTTVNTTGRVPRAQGIIVNNNVSWDRIRRDCPRRLARP